MRRCSAKLTTLLAGVILISALILPVTAQAADFDLAKLKDGGYVVLLRHFKAGGVDADDFDLADCRTQREVGAAGRAQAEVLKARFRAAGITEATVLTSQWCRARQTGELLGLGPIQDEIGINYFHWKVGSESEMNERLRRYFTELEAPAAGEPPLILVSHKTAFIAIGQDSPPSGGGLVLKPNGSGVPEVVGTITAPE